MNISESFSHHEHFQKVPPTLIIFRTVWRSVPGSKLQGPSGPQPSKPLPKGYVLVRNAQEGRWERGLIIKDNITFLPLDMLVL